MYVPMIGLLIVVSWGVPDLVERCGGPARLVPMAASAVVVASAIAARAQVAHWTDSVTLWEHATRATPDSYIAFENLGQALRERGQLEEAVASYQRALALAPAGSPAYQAVIYNSLGLVRTRQGRADSAIAQFAAAARLNPRFAEAQSNLGNALAASNRFPKLSNTIAPRSGSNRISPKRWSVLEARSSARTRPRRLWLPTTTRYGSIPASHRHTTAWALRSRCRDRTTARSQSMQRR